MDKVQVVHDVQVYYLNNFLCIEAENIQITKCHLVFLCYMISF